MEALQAEGATVDGMRVIVRLAPELTQKSRRTRKRFLSRLVRNLRDALETEGVTGTVQSRWDQIVLDGEPGSDVSFLGRVFGVASYSQVALTVPAELDAIVAAGVEVYGDRVQGRTYAVRTKRSGRHPFTSQDVSVQLGAALNHLGKVDLGSPDVVVPVEVRDHEARIYEEKTPGPGGLPLGVEGRAVCLISGGFDSAVAAWMMLKRGVELDYVFCNLAGPAFERSVLQVTKVLTDRWSYGNQPRVHVVEAQEAVENLQAHVTPRYWQVVLKRVMYRIAQSVAEDVGADAIVTGESVGQVSSQTLKNLRAIEAVSDLPILRPLVGLDKEDIISRAHLIGTGALSARIKEYCAILQGRPVTAAKVAAVDDEESRMDLSLLESAAAERRVLKVRKMTSADLTQPYLFVESIPPEAAVVDCRFEHHDDGWRWPGAVRISPTQFSKAVGSLDKDRVFVMFCEHGIQSTQFAEILQRAGFEAYSLKGGTKAAKRLQET